MRRETRARVARPRTRTFKHYSSCVNCGELLVHMGQADSLTGADVWHLRTEGRGWAMEVVWSVHCYDPTDTKESKPS